MPSAVSPRSPGLRASTGLLTGAGRERSVPLRGRISRQLANCCIARLLVLAMEDAHRPIIVYIDSPGGPVAESMPILSTLRGIRSPIVTFCRGQAGGTAAIIAAHGREGFRVAAPDACFFFERLSDPIPPLGLGRRRTLPAPPGRDAEQGRPAAEERDSDVVARRGSIQCPGSRWVRPYRCRFKGAGASLSRVQCLKCRTPVKAMAI